jgi:hypothetical protein
VIRLPLADVGKLEVLDGRSGGTDAVVRVLLVEKNGRSAAGTVEALAGSGLDIRHAPSFETARDLLDEWAPTVVVVAGDVASTLGHQIDRFKVPVLLLAEAGGGGDGQLGSRVVRLGAAASPEVILDALRDLGE